MNILLFIDNLGSGGAQRQLVNLAVLFKENGHNIKFLVYGDVPFFEKKLIDNNIEVIKIIEKNSVKRLLKIRKFIRRNWQDVVISFLNTPNFIACFSAIGKHTWKLITNERSGTEQSFKGLKNKIFIWFERFSDYKICNSKSAANLWLSYYPKIRNKIDVIYNFIDIDLDKFDKKIKKNTDKTIITVAASYQKIKNVLNVIEAINLLNENEKNKIKINWYGNKEVTIGNRIIYNNAVELIKKYNLENSITLNDATNQIYDKMYQSDFVGLFSEYEGLPNTICEAIYLGKPIIMTPVSDYAVLLNNNGVLCSSYDAVAIKKALQEIINLSNDSIVSMGQNSKKISTELFEREKILNKWNSIINK